MTSLATNSDNDIFVGPDGNLVLASGLFGVQQDCEHAMKTQLGEMVLALTEGLPTLDTIWLIYKPAQFEAAARAALLGVPNVVAVTAFSIERVGDVASYTATIKTNFGLTPISGSLVQ